MVRSYATGYDVDGKLVRVLLEQLIIIILAKFLCDREYFWVTFHARGCRVKRGFDTSPSLSE